MADIDIGQISEALNNKVDLTSSWKAPTSNKTSLSFTHGATYTAPADGYFTIRCYNTSSSLASVYGFKNNSNSLYSMSIQPNSSSSASGVCIPAKKGDSVIAYGYGATIVEFYFVYAQSSN